MRRWLRAILQVTQLSDPAVEATIRLPCPMRGWSAAMGVRMTRTWSGVLIARLSLHAEISLTRREA